MEYCYQYNSVSSSNLAKEKRPAPKRGHVKMQIVRTISNIVAPSSGNNSFRRERSYN
ncbi:hypothetical protein SETIT_3G212900v2 [Setaria italica]|uniref:Uncharacterized protein n=2 Tax=Setaria TaxID=4554 RepID=K3ZBQ1_SETIT|nr:hypothetical protein SETIT_3G212900v2 [Setaria italica]TKW26837.1 hypothetical protein SEVIR_3G217700v2 [Setaria viridis]